ncbi:protein PAF1 homolog [Ricinus communis]|uniref:RNA polymerase II-associated factor 1 homolog n=1 Tax=Ricinus communis TaxID=3988 RepID=B9RQE5_RICCO|nr:protein PAF1 homolog [Ricinus communis]EEF46384.1 conserved hypothetical protein [Ricinus communis]|eukprot:XP_002515964.1 protein PAF1 homolog [Ricinus communis]
MASYRQFPSQSTLPPPPPPPPPQQQQQQQRPNQYNQMQIPNQQKFSQHYPPPPPPPPHQQYPYQQPPPPPPPDSSYPPPPPPPPASGGYYPSSQYPPLHGHQPLQQPMQPPPPPPPSSPPPSSSMPPPPPPPPSSPPPPPPPKESGGERDKGMSRERRELGNSNHGDVSRHEQQHRPPAPPPGGKKVSGPPSGRVETEEERRLRKKREFEKHRQEEKHRQQVKESQNSILQKTQMLSAQKGHGSIVGSRMGDRRAPPLLGGERIENRLKKPTTFLCKLKFRNELPDPSAQPKLMTMKRDKDRFTKYTITSLEKMYKPQLFVEPDLGIPLDLLDLSVYNRPPASERPPLDPEDEELLRDDEAVTPVKREGLKIKERPTDKGVSWLVKTQYISSLSTDSTKQSMTEKQAKELRERKGGHNLLKNLNNRESQIKEIEASFEACKLTPVHATNKNLKPVEILPLIPDFDRYEDKFVTVAFDNAPTADSEIYSKLDSSVREACESRAVMKACVATGSDPANPEKFLAYMAPSPNELSKDMYDENEDISYNWVREYHWDVQGDGGNDPTTFLVSFDEDAARYVPLPTKINLRKKRAREGRSGDEVEHFPAPSSVTVRRRPTAAARELRDSAGASSSRGNILDSRMGTGDDDDGLGRVHRVARDDDLDHSSEAEDDLSE